MTCGVEINKDVKKKKTESKVIVKNMTHVYMQWNKNER